MKQICKSCKPKKISELKTSFCTCRADDSIGKGKIELLEKINEAGSINKAAKALGVSYKTAWDVINTMNNFFSRPIVNRGAGGKGGGGTRLTETGTQLIKMYRNLERQQQKYIDNFRINTPELKLFFPLFKKFTIKLGVRNQLRGTIKKIIKDSVHVKIILALDEKNEICAIITKKIARRMKLKKGMNLSVLLKSTSIKIAEVRKVSRGINKNKLIGEVHSIKADTHYTEIVLDLGNETFIVSLMPNRKFQKLNIQKSEKALASFDAENVILGLE
ncbi:TOBE domain-containing protein [Candidatus Riflebacteria bacterium]